MTLLSHIANSAGAKRIAQEDGVAVVSIEGLDNRARLLSFDWLAEKILGEAVTGL